MRRIWIVSVLMGLVLAGCTSTQKGTLVSPQTDPVQVSGALGSKPSVTIVASTPPTALLPKDIQVGTGAEAKSGSQVGVQYVGIAWSTKAEFDASWNRGQPFEFTLGSGQVIRGWDQGVAGMKVGGRRLLIIPPDLGYGAAGAGGAIGPNETLVFVVDLVSVG